MRICATCLVLLFLLGYPARLLSQPPPAEFTFSEGVTAQERARATAWANELIDTIRRMPRMAKTGFQLVTHVHVALDNLDQDDDVKRPAYVVADIQFNLAPTERTARGLEPDERNSIVSLTMKVNQAGFVPAARELLLDDQGVFISGIEGAAGTVHNHPVFETGNGDKWTVILRNDVPFFAPLTADRYMLAQIKAEETRLADLKARRAKIPAGVPQDILAEVDEAVKAGEARLEAMKKQYAGISASQSAAQAYFAPSTEEGQAPQFVALEGSSESALFYMNPALMDSRLPRSEPQILAVSVDHRMGPDGMADEVEAQVDWAALEKFVHR